MLFDNNKNKVFHEKFNFWWLGCTIYNIWWSVAVRLLEWDLHFLLLRCHISKGFCTCISFTQKPLRMRRKKKVDYSHKVTAKSATIYHCVPFFVDLSKQMLLFCQWFMEAHVSRTSVSVYFHPCTALLKVIIDSSAQSLYIYNIVTSQPQSKEKFQRVLVRAAWY